MSQGRTGRRCLDDNAALRYFSVIGHDLHWTDHCDGVWEGCRLPVYMVNI